MALLDGSRVIAKGFESPPAEKLLPLIDDLRSEAKGFDPELIAVGLGPGSFTGTRVGLATVKGMVLANPTPLIGVCSLAALARSVGPGSVTVLSDAGRNQVYTAQYDVSEGAPVVVVQEPRLASIAEVEGHDFGREPLAELAIHLGIEGMLRAERDGPDDAAAIEPLYVRPSDAKLPAKPLKVPST